MALTLELTPEEQAIMKGEQGETLQKVMQTVVTFGELFGATKLVDLQAAPHLAMSWSSDAVLPFIEIYEKLVAAGLKTYAPFTSNPKPMDHNNLDPGEEKRVVVQELHKHHHTLGELYSNLGMKENAWSCACFVPQIGNTPQQGDFISWSESSAINFANSYLGARTNRNSVGIDMMTAILGKAPYFDLLTDEGRKADWLIDCSALTKLPHPELLGAVIGLKVMEDIPYIIGMDDRVNALDDVVGYCKDLGAATASNGAVGLFHMEGVTPEARDQGRSLLKSDHQLYVISDAELQRVFNSYPVLWPDENAKPERVFIGCPHNTLAQLRWWGERIVSALEAAGKDAVSCPPYLFAHDNVASEFKENHPELKARMAKYGISVTNNCPVMYMTTPKQSDEIVCTNSNKTRVYSKSRFYMDDDLVHIIVTGQLPDQAPKAHP
ncbi:DUF521 domain-containing protein [Pseudomaricurvus alkylphenolicus]|uniref:aconitase X n=1 Tax=Pseudomaricurvus alkylphenolicus TaxID=1306991 RepID=UPI00141F4E97|nr:aconitase X [Pseudomaricurvus alkylphenolicus]NIB38615.1 DUF521 domain-containing protein [Pseudomaricurvus alkylphenolicus]